MIKIEMALLKCQLEESHIEQLEIQRRCQFVDENQLRQRALEAYASNDSNKAQVSGSQRAKQVMEGYVNPLKRSLTKRMSQLMPKMPSPMRTKQKASPLLQEEEERR